MSGRKNRKTAGILILTIVLFCMVTIFCCGCKEEDTEEVKAAAENIVTLRMIALGNEPDEGMEEWYSALDELTAPELGCTIRLEFIPWGNERKQLNIAAASGEYDLLPMGVFSDYRTLVEKNAFLDLNEYLHLVPDMVEHYKYYDEDFLENSEIRGGLYGIPQHGSGSVQYVGEGFFYREDLRKEWGLERVTDLESMEAYLYRAKKDPRYQQEALITDNRIWMSLWILLSRGRYLEIGSPQETPFVVVSASEPDVVLNRLETPEFKEVLEYLKKWKRDGILDGNMLALTDNEGLRGRSLILRDQKPCETNAPIWTVGANYIPDLVREHPDWEFDFFCYITANEEQYANRPVASSRISVSSKTKYPETAIRFLEKLHTDKRYYDLFLYGVEGIHYHLVDGKVSYAGIPSSNRFGMNVAGDGLLNYPGVAANEQWGAVEDRVYAWDEEAVRKARMSPLDGFEYMAEGLETVADNMEEARLLYLQPLVCGYYEGEDDIAEAVEELEKLGLDRYMEIIQKELDKQMKKTGRGTDG